MPSDPSPCTLEEVLDQYLQELADGQSPDPEAYLLAHPGLAESLRGVFRTLEFIETTSHCLNLPRLEEGGRLGDFRLIREVGRGGMGVVYEAEQTSLNRRVALKILPYGATLSTHARERFRREAETAGRLHHTNIVPVYAVGEEQEIHFYAMQFIDGCTVAERLHALHEGHAHLDGDDYRKVARWGMQVAGALAYAHGEGTIHRDVKPSNLLVDHRDNVWVTDFGLARSEAAVSITGSGDVVGTARYMSPEQARGGHAEVDERTDMYSLGITLYELLTLTPAFDGESRESVLNQIATTDPRPIRQVAPGVSRDLETVVTKCMEKDPGRRYPSARDLAEDLRRFLDHEPIRARRTSLLVKGVRLLRRYRVHAIGTAVALVLTLVALFLVLDSRRQEGQRSVALAADEILFERDFNRAHELLDRAESLGARDDDLDFYRGLMPLLDNQPQDAFEPLQRLVRHDPDHVEGSLALALAHTLSGDFPGARPRLERHGEHDIDTALGWLLHGLSLSKMVQSEAVDSFDRSVALQPDFIPAIQARAHYRGLRLQTEGAHEELDRMLKDLDALVVFRPNSSFAYTSRASGWLCAAAYASTHPELVTSQDRWLENCRADLERAVQLRREGESMVFHEQGIFCRYVGDFSGAEQAFTRALAADAARDDSVDPALVHRYTMMQYALGDIAGALEGVTPVSQAVPSFYPLMFERSLLLAELGLPEQARALCRELIQRQRRHATALFLSTVLMEFLGDPDTASVAIEAFAARDPREVTGEDAGMTTRSLALAYLQGQRSADEVLAAAAIPAARCELAFLIGLRELGRGRREDGLARLQSCVTSGIYRFIEHRVAQVLLARAEGDPSWPPWLQQN